MSWNTRLTSSPTRWAVLAALCLFASCAPASAPSGTAWKTFAPDGAGFSVLMPAVPERDRRYAKNEGGTIETNVYTHLLADGGVYTIVDQILPPGTDLSASVDNVLDDAAKRQVYSASGEIVSQQKVFLSGHPGRRVEATVPESAIPGGAVLKGRLYLVGHRLYEIIAVVPKADAGSPDTDRFLDSFQIKESER